MFEEEEAESGLRASGSFLSADSAMVVEMVAEKMKRNKTAGAKPLSAEDLAIQTLTTEKVVAAVSRSDPIVLRSTEPMVPRYTEAKPIMIDEAWAAGEDQVGGSQAEETTGLAGVTFSTGNSGELPPVNIKQ